MLTILERLYPWAEKLVGVDLVEGHAWTENVEQGEPLVFDTRLDQGYQLLDIAGVAARHPGCAVGNRTGNRVERQFDTAVRGALGLHPDLTGGGYLTGGQTVNLVVHHQVENVEVAPAGVGEVIAADTVLMLFQLSSHPASALFPKNIPVPAPSA